MFLAIGLCVAFGVSRILAVSITASDLPECAIECYVNTGAKIEIPITDYEGQCRSGEFQVQLRQCAEIGCSQEEYAFVSSLRNKTDNRRSFMLKNTVPSLEWILITS